jgi:hypothetical protein
MSMTPTIVVAVPPYQIAEAALRRLASDQFLRYQNHAYRDADAYDTWRDLRRYAALLLERGALQLSEDECYALGLVLSGIAPNSDTEYLLELRFDEVG